MIPSRNGRNHKIECVHSIAYSNCCWSIFQSNAGASSGGDGISTKKPKTKRGKRSSFFLASIIASLITGFSTTFWSQSTALEVYALHLVMVLLTIWMFVSGLEEQLTEPGTVSRKFILFAFILGLSFSNHMTTILLAPGFMWLYFRTFGLRKQSFLQIFKVALFFLLGLSVYVYLPIRSANHPLLDWGHPATLERFFWHVSGKQFRVWMFSGWSVVEKQLSYYCNNFISELAFLYLHVSSSACLRCSNNLTGSLRSLPYYSALQYCMLSIMTYLISIHISCFPTSSLVLLLHTESFL